LSLRSPECIGNCGCQYESYPYTAKIPLIIGGKKYPRVTFTCDEDVWEYIHLLVEDIKEVNKTHDKNFSLGEGIYGQLPFFACKRFLYSKEYQDDIYRYSYCSAFNVPAYEGHYGLHPKKWIDKSFYIKSILEKEQKKEYGKANAKQ
tara:strand:+ start:8835 stop:9275 length:441 start_codon:yes stop_codon:yes gene_type:complete